MTRPPLGLFDAFGVELEYMLVDAATLDVLPRADEVFRAVTGEYVGDWDNGPISWSNELVLHVVELKTNGPGPSLSPLAAQFQDNVRRVNEIAASIGACLMPTAMHPWMDPHGETRLWPHEYSPVYEAYNRIFDCRGHGWSNLQSTHVNLPFANDEEFGRLHAAIRLVLPILPALSASSPYVEGRATGVLDNRMEFYRHNSAKIPAIAGRVVPEAVFARADYERDILQASYRAIAPHDPDGILQDEFLNSRGAIARFGRGSIEIRVLDIQECPAADLALVELIVATLKAQCDGLWVDASAQRAWDVDPLANLFVEVVRRAEGTTIDSAEYLRAFGMKANRPTTGELWRHITDDLRKAGRLEVDPVLDRLLEAGTLSTRLLRRGGATPDRGALKAIYRELNDCLANGRLFDA